MAKEILGLIKLQIPAGGANPSPPVGPALGQRGLNIMDFCKAFNDKTKDLEKGAPIPVIITAYKDRSFDFVTKLPPVSYYLKKAAKFEKLNLFGSLLIPSKQFITRFKFRPWKGVHISEKFLYSLEDFYEFTRHLVCFYKKNNITPVIETDFSSIEKLNSIISFFED